MSPLEMAALQRRRLRHLRRRLKEIRMCDCEDCVFETLKVMQRNAGIYIVFDTGKMLQRRLEEPIIHVDLKKWLRDRKIHKCAIIWRKGIDGKSHAIAGCDQFATGWVSLCGKIITGPVRKSKPCADCLKLS